MRRLLPRFEHRAQPVISPGEFLVRLGRSVVVALVMLGVSLFIGMAGYHFTEGLGWLDSFLNSAMLLGGMGPVNAPVTSAGKFFAGLFALYCGVAVILVSGVILAPVAHRVLHRFHVDAPEGEGGNAPAAHVAKSGKADGAERTRRGKTGHSRKA